MAQRQAVLGQLRLEAGTGGAGADRCRQGDLVDLEQAIQGAQVDRDGAVVAGADIGRDAADDRGAAAEGDRGDAGARAPLEQPLEVLLVARLGDDVGGVLELAAEAADDVAVGLAERVDGAVVGVAGADRGERVRGLDTRRRAAGAASRRTGCSTLAELDAEPLASSAGAAARACSGVGCWSSWPQPQCLRLRVLTGASLCTRRLPASPRPPSIH